MKILSKNPCIGVWGFGIVGKSVVNYFHNHGYTVNIMDKRMPTIQEYNDLKIKDIQWYHENDQETFFYSHDYIVVSPGVNIGETRYATYKDKWLHELDFFYTTFNKPIIAITGSVGKTSITHLLNEIYKELSISIAVGGNIGTATFDLIDQQNNVNCALLEVSSFQLNHCKHFAPQLAIWTNFYPNHLDHHATEEEYFLAKHTILAYQTHNQFSLIPFALKDRVATPINGHMRSYFISTCPEDSQLRLLTHDEQIYYIKNNTIMRYAHNKHTSLMLITPELYNLSFSDNIIILAATCDILRLPHKALQNIATTAILPSHRIEKIGSIHLIDFYNDSKATTTASTLAAVKKLSNRPLHLFLGGLSKGVDREPFIAQLKNKVKRIYCFGKEADILYSMCVNHDISATSHLTLNQAVNACITYLQPQDCVLLSPAGSSFDLYENYEKRGEHFKELIMQYIEKQTSL